MDMYTPEYLEKIVKTQLLATFQLKLEKGWYWQKKENMCPWKVFSEAHFKNRDFLWLLFRVYKLCGAKYKYFKEHFDEFQPYTSEMHRFSNFPDNCSIEYWLTSDGFKHKKTGYSISFTRLQMISDKPTFLFIMKLLTESK